MPGIDRLGKFQQLSSNFHLWFGLSLGVPLYFGLISLHYALSQDYLVQDDARLHIVWLQRFVDPQLFADDLIAQYFSAIAPFGFKGFYWLVAKLGIEPIMLAKVLPTILGLIATVYLFRVSLLILPVPAGAFWVTLIFNQNMWLQDNLVSSSPRAFIYPLFAAFLYYLLRGALIPSLIAMTLQGLFYPQLLLVEVAVLTLRLWSWQGRWPQLRRERTSYILWLCGLIVTLVVTILFTQSTSEFGTVVTAAQMKAMPEFGLHGRREYFGVDALSFAFGGASGLRAPLYPPVIGLALSLPLVLNSRLPLVRRITQAIKILWQITIASLGLFILAHLLFTRLYLPSRYTYYSLRFILSIAAGIVLTVLLDAGWHWLQQRNLGLPETLLAGLVGLFITAVIVVPAVPPIFLSCQNWVVGQAPAIYQFLSRQPKETLVASLAEEANNIPAFSQRSVLVGQEFALPYHLNYYDQIEQRAIDLVMAQYSSDLSDTQRIIQKYGIDFFLIENTALNPEYLFRQPWLVNSSFQSVVHEIASKLKQGATPALAEWIKPCSVVSRGNLILLEAACLNEAPS